MIPKIRGYSVLLPLKFPVAKVVTKASNWANGAFIGRFVSIGVRTVNAIKWPFKYHLDGCLPCDRAIAHECRKIA